MHAHSQRSTSYTDAMAHAQETVYSLGTPAHPRFDVVCGDDEYGTALRAQWQVAKVMPARVCDQCGQACTETLYDCHEGTGETGPYTTEHARHAACQAAMDAEAEAWGNAMDAAHDQWLASLSPTERAEYDRYVVEMNAEYDAALAAANALPRW